MDANTSNDCVQVLTATNAPIVAIIIKNPFGVNMVLRARDGQTPIAEVIIHGLSKLRAIMNPPKPVFMLEYYYNINTSIDLPAILQTKHVSQSNTWSMPFNESFAIHEPTIQGDRASCILDTNMQITALEFCRKYAQHVKAVQFIELAEYGNAPCKVIVCSKYQIRVSFGTACAGVYQFFIDSNATRAQLTYVGVEFRFD